MKTAYVIYFVAFLTVVALMVVGSAGDWLPQDLLESAGVTGAVNLEGIHCLLSAVDSRHHDCADAIHLLDCLVALSSAGTNRVNYPDRRGRVTQLPDNLPAPLVSVLKSREVSDRTLLTVVLDMCSKGSLELHGGVSLGGRYYLEQSGEPEHDWERSILDSMPKPGLSPRT